MEGNIITSSTYKLGKDTMKYGIQRLSAIQNIFEAKQTIFNTDIINFILVPTC